MYYDDMISTIQANKLRKQVPACDCSGAITQVKPNKEGLCPNCGHYAFLDFEWNVKSQLKKKLSTVDRKNTAGITQAKDMRAQGLSIKEIAVELDLSVSSITKYLKGEL